MDLRTRLTLEGSDFGNALNDATKQVEDFQKKTEGTSKSVDDMGKATSKTASALLKEMKNMEGLGRSAGNYRSQLAQMTRQIQDLTINYRSMSDEMKNSDFGREVASKIDELTQKAGEYKDAIIDAQMSVRTLSSDTAGWDAMKGGIDLVSSSMQAFVATGVLGEKTTENLVGVLAKLKAMEAATSAAIKIGNALQKQSALMMGIAKVQAAALARAKAIETTSTKGATIAQKVFNAVANANPYVLLATAVLAVGTALVAFTRRSNEAKQKEEELQKATQKAKEKFDDFKTSVGSAVGDVLGKFKNLQREWSNLQTTADKKKWIDDNADSFKELGLKVDDVNGAEKVFVEQADDVIAALVAKAKAAATMQLYMKEYTKVVDAQIEADKKLADEEAKGLQKRFTSGNMVGSSVPKEWQEAGLGEQSGDLKFTWAGGQSGAGYWEMTQKGYDKYIAHVKAEGQKLVDEAKISVADYERMVNAAEKEAAERAKKIQELMKPRGTGGDGSSKTTQEIEIKYEEGSYNEAQAKIRELQDMLNNMDANDASFSLIVSELEAWKAIASDIKDRMTKVKEDAKPVAGSYAEAAAMVSMLSKELQNLDPKTEEFTMVKFELESWKEELEEIKKLMGEVEEDAKDTKEEISGWEATGNLLDAFGTIQSSIQSIYDTWKGFSESMEEAENPFEQMMTGVSAVLSTLQSITSVLETMNKLSALFNALENASWLIEKKKTEEKMKQTGVNAANLALEEQEAVASATKAAGEAGSSASKIPMVGWIVAIGAIAAIIAAIASAKSSLHFAQGGIVPGSSFSGDKIGASLNSGEMVLNKHQQNNLFNLLDNGAPAGGHKVEFVLKGQELHGLLDNYNKKMTRI